MVTGFAGILQFLPTFPRVSSGIPAGKNLEALINEILADLKGCPYAWGAQGVESMFFILVY